MRVWCVGGHLVTTSHARVRPYRSREDFPHPNVPKPLPPVANAAVWRGLRPWSPRYRAVNVLADRPRHSRHDVIYMSRPANRSHPFLRLPLPSQFTPSLSNSWPCSSRRVRQTLRTQFVCGPDDEIRLTHLPHYMLCSPHADLAYGACISRPQLRRPCRARPVQHVGRWGDAPVVRPYTLGRCLHQTPCPGPAIRHTALAHRWLQCRGRGGGLGGGRGRARNGFVGCYRFSDSASS